jgi:hypothetical protein
MTGDAAEPLDRIEEPGLAADGQVEAESTNEMSAGAATPAATSRIAVSRPDSAVTADRAARLAAANRPARSPLPRERACMIFSYRVWSVTSADNRSPLP